MLRPDALYDVAFRLEENRWNGTVAPQLIVRRVFATPARFAELRDWLVAEYKKPPPSRDTEAAAIFAELGLDDVAGARAARRHLLESARFRALLTEQPLARAA
jgi:hypothetical protein